MCTCIYRHKYVYTDLYKRMVKHMNAYYKCNTHTDVDTHIYIVATARKTRLVNTALLTRSDPINQTPINIAYSLLLTLSCPGVPRVGVPTEMEGHRKHFCFPLTSSFNCLGNYLGLTEISALPTCADGGCEIPLG